MRFQERFDLPNAIHSRDSEIALPGTDVSSGRPITVHLLLDPQSSETAELLRNLSGLSAERRQQVLDEGEYGGIPYVVTYPLPDDSSLRSWISTPEVQRPAAVLRPAGYKTPEPGEFTRLFQARSFEPLSQANSKSEAPSVPAAVSAETELKPGEFTALLRSFSDPRETLKAPAPEVKPPAPAVEAPPVHTPPTAPSERGEFTRMMRSPLHPEPETPIAKPVPKDKPGEFTRLVQGDLGLDSRAKDSAPRSPVYQPSAPPREMSRAAGEFTRMLEKQEPLSDDLFSSPTPVRSPLPSSGFATGAFSSPAVPPAPAPVSGPSEFTRIIQSPLAQSPVAPVSPPVSVQAPAPATPNNNATPKDLAPQRRASYAPLIVILAVLLIVGIALVTFFVLHR